MSKVLSALCLLPTLVMAAFIIKCWDCTQATITLFGVVRCMLNNQLPLKQKYIIIIYLRLEQMDRNSFNINKNRHCYIIFSISLLFASSFSQTLVIFLGSSPLVCLALQGGSSCWPSKFGKISFADMWNSWRTFLKRRFNHESNWVQTLGKNLSYSAQPFSDVKGLLSISKVRLIQGREWKKAPDNKLFEQWPVYAISFLIGDHLHLMIPFLAAEQQSFQFCKPRLPKQITNPSWQHRPNPWLGCRWCGSFLWRFFKFSDTYIVTSKEPVCFQHPPPYRISQRLQMTIWS